MKNTYARKPETIQAVRAFRDNRSELEMLAPDIFPWTDWDSQFVCYWQIPSDLTVGIGEWLIKHEDGRFSTMTNEEFNKMYKKKK